LHELADIDLALFDESSDGRQDRGVSQFLSFQVHGSLEALYFLNQVARLVDGILVTRLQGLKPGLGLIQFLLRANALLHQIPNPLETLFGVEQVRLCPPDFRSFADILDLVFFMAQSQPFERLPQLSLVLRHNVALFLLRQADQNLALVDPIAQIEIHHLDKSLDFRADGDFLKRKQRADRFDVTLQLPHHHAGGADFDGTGILLGRDGGLLAAACQDGRKYDKNQGNAQWNRLDKREATILPN
jgi:hypothetical protein